MGGPQAWGLGEMIANSHRNNWPCYEAYICVSGLE
jgi:hypothetical protein